MAAEELAQATRRWRWWSGAAASKLARRRAARFLGKAPFRRWAGLPPHRPGRPTDLADLGRPGQTVGSHGQTYDG
eukprot:1086175-Prymnesium_polylepis.1